MAIRGPTLANNPLAVIHEDGVPLGNRQFAIPGESSRVPDVLHPSVPRLDTGAKKHTLSSKQKVKSRSRAQHWAGRPSETPAVGAKPINHKLLSENQRLHDRQQKIRKKSPPKILPEIPETELRRIGVVAQRERRAVKRSPKKRPELSPELIYGATIGGQNTLPPIPSNDDHVPRVIEDTQGRLAELRELCPPAYETEKYLKKWLQRCKRLKLVTAETVEAIHEYLWPTTPTFNEAHYDCYFRYNGKTVFAVI